MKKIIPMTVFSVIITLACAVSCTKKSTPAAPAGAANTATCTVTNTPLPTGTNTVTPTVTETATFTVTPTSTATCTNTPDIFMIDNFNDNDLINMVPKSGGSNSWGYGYGGNVVTQYYGPVPATGMLVEPYCFAISATAQANGYSSPVIPEFFTCPDTSCSTGYNFYSYENFNFSYRLRNTTAGATYTLVVHVENPGGYPYINYEISALQGDGVWHNVTCPTAAFSGSATVQAVLENTYHTTMVLYVFHSDTNTIANVDLSFDNVYYSH